MSVGAEALEHLVEHRPVQRIGAAEIALQEVGQPDEVLLWQRLVEAEIAIEPSRHFPGLRRSRGWPSPGRRGSSP